MRSIPSFNKLALTALAACGVAAGAWAYDIITVEGREFVAAQVYEIRYASDGSDNVVVATTDGEVSVPMSDGKATVTFGVTGADKALVVGWTAEGGAVVEQNGYTADELDVAVDGGYVTVTQLGAAPVEARLHGESAAGRFKVYATSPALITLDGLALANDDGSAINVQSADAVTVSLLGENTLSDSKKYNSTPEGETESGALYAGGPLTLAGTGSLTATGVKKHAIVSAAAVTVDGPAVEIASAGSDGVHSEGFVMQAGTFVCPPTGGDCIDAGAGTLDVNGGTIEVELTTADVKGLKADGDITLAGGTVRVTNNSDQGKGIKTKGTFTMTGGELLATAAGNVLVVDNDPSYCTIVKADGNIAISGGLIDITHTGASGKGLSADGDALISGGNITIACSGNGATYVNLDGDDDCHSATCITVDGNLTVSGGTLSLTNTGTAGKCLKSDLDMVIGLADGSDGPQITASTSGAKILVSGSTGSVGGWGGWGDNADYSNPKVLKADGDLTVNAGLLNLTSTVDGGEGLESKNILTINGGTIYAKTYDDCVNAKNHIQINGGQMRFQATNNDAIDSNGTIEITGGTVLAYGASTPEESFDCDNNRFVVTGGVLVGYAGTVSTPTASACTQRCIIYNSASVAKNTVLTLAGPDGSQIVSFKNTGNVTSGTVFVSAPGITTGTHTFYTGGTLTGGETFDDMTWGASYTPGTSKTTCSPSSSSMVTTVGGSSGPGGGGNRP